MSFTQFLQDDPLQTRADYMRLFIDVANDLGLEEKPAAVLAGMCAMQEVGVQDGDAPFERRIWCPANPTNEPESARRNPDGSQVYPHDSESDDGRSCGICQQQRGPNGELWWGTVADEMNPRMAIRTFMSRLPTGFHANDGVDAGQLILAANTANDVVQGVQRSGVPEAYAQWWGDAVRLYNEVKAGAPVTVPMPPHEVEYEHGPWTGDPVWLADVLRAEGLTVVETPGWLESGHGDMQSLWGVVNHHTGNRQSTWQSIRDGRPDLAGPLSQIHLRLDGVVELVAVGVCWHAGTGYAPGCGRHNANQRCIGIECQNDGSPPPGSPHRTGWPDEQYDALVKINAAFDRRIDADASHSISHQEWDDGDPPTDEGKWDPGAIDMDIFRADVQTQINSGPTGDDDMPTHTGRSWSMYRTTDDDMGWQGTDMEFRLEGLAHEELTERLAVQGEMWHLSLVHRIANSDSTMPAVAAGQPGIADRANIILGKATKAAQAKAKTLAAKQLVAPE